MSLNRNFATTISKFSRHAWLLRDNVGAMQEHRRQDPGHWGLTKTVIEIRSDHGASIERGLPGWEKCDG